MTFTLRRYLARLSAILLVGTSGSLFAQTATWNKTGTDFWADPANWNWVGTIPASGLPDSNTTVAIHNGGTAQITNSSQSTGALTMNSGRIEILRDTSAATLTSHGAVTVGNTSSQASVIIDGAGSEWIKQSSGQFQIGVSGNGSLTVRNSATLTNAAITHIGLGNGTGTSGVGVFTVETLGQAFINSTFILGYRGNGTMIVQTGGYVKSNNGFIAGYGADTNRVQGTAAVTVRNSGSKWETGILYVGHTGTGTMTIEDEGQVINSSISAIGHYNNGTGATAPPPKYGTGTVNVRTGGLWQSSQGISVGSFGTGTLNIASGGTVSVGLGAGTVTLAANDIASGRINIGADPLAVGSTPEAPGILRAATVTSGSGSGAKSLTFYHSDNTGDYHFTKTGAVGGGNIAIAGAVAVQALAGTTTFSGANTYGGGTTIGGDATAAATLIINHASALGSGPLTVSARGTLELGSSVAQLTLGSLTLKGDSGLTFSANPAGGDATPRFDVATLDFQATPENKVIINLTNTSAISGDLELYDWTFLVADEIVGDPTDSFEVVSEIPGFYVFRRDNSLVIGHVVPEPGRSALVCIGGILFILRRRRDARFDA